jgi:hypothetical protein
MRYFAVSLAAFSTLLLAPPNALAQLAQVNFKGKVLSVSPDGWVAVQLEDKVILAGVNKRRIEDNVEMRGIPEPKIEIEGQESIKFLQAGMFVRFSAQVIGEKRIVEPVDEVTIFDRTADSVFGLLPNDIPAPAAGDAEPGKGNEEAQDMLVSGQLSNVRGTTMMIAFPDRKPIRATLSRDAVVKYRSSDPRMIRPGDPIDVAGLQVKPNKVFALEVKISRVASEPPNRPLRGQRHPREQQANEADDEADEPAPPTAPDPAQAAPQAPTYRGKIVIIN